MKTLTLEFYVGLFVVAGLLALSWMAVTMGDVRWFTGKEQYQVTARFESISGLKEGANVEMAGVAVGKVERIQFDPEYYEAVVTLSVRNDIELPIDSIPSVRTAGIIGDKFIKIVPGGAEELLSDGDEFEQTESALDIEELISKFVFSSGE